MLELDHVAISGETLEDARRYCEEALGVSLQDGGEHAVFHTHNALLGLADGVYLEAIAINPDAPAPDRPRWFDLDCFSGSARLNNWICRTPDMAGLCKSLDLDVGAPVSLTRGDLRWDMAVPQTGKLPFDNCAPAVIQWHSPVHPATQLEQKGVRLQRLTIFHPEVAQLKEALRQNLVEERIAFEQGPAGLSAEFETPHGLRYLGT